MLPSAARMQTDSHAPSVSRNGGRYVGASVPRLEDPRFLTGAGRYVGDLQRHGLLHAHLLRSPHAHARVASIDTQAARAQPGVEAVLTFDDLAEGGGPIPIRLSPLSSLREFLQWPLAHDRVRYVGEPVAVVVAHSRYTAEDAAELVEVVYEPLPAVVYGRAALEPGAPVLHDKPGTNLAAEFSMVVGDVDTAFADADVVIRERFKIQRHTANPIETRGLMAEFDRGRGILTVWGATKVPHFNRAVLAELLGIGEHQIHFVEGDVGGGFGVRGEFYPEDFLIPLLALRIGRPVQWIEDRQEHLQAANHSREQEHDVEIAVRGDGTICGLRDRIVNDMGAYIRTHGATVPTLTASMLPGPYVIPNYRCEVRCVLTNKTPAGTYRGPGRFEAAFVRERLIDLVARRLELDPADVRRRNFIPSTRMPYDTGLNALGTHIVYDSGNYAALFEQALAAVDYPALRADLRRARALGRSVGVGLGYFVEKSGLGPWEYARVEVDPSGQVVVYSGLASVGQGMETSLAQVCADALSVDYRAISVRHGDSDTVPYGMGAFASRGAVLASNAVRLAAQAVKDKALEVAAQLLEVSLDDLELASGGVRVRGAPERGLGLGAVAQALRPTRALAGGWLPGLSAERFYEVDHMAYPYGVH
ncbi:MAG: xanthine dehydrogenase family protein molybdopterin-binding subunit, partial [Chloroflexi bacterium]|nr:xanthine dehydrogenase family protein molybdopterin-binding subunit [Chloroflexota bacterium]